MALQVGELFASFTVDTSAAERALDRIEQRAALTEERILGPSLTAMGERAMETLSQALGGDRGREITLELMAGLRAGVQDQTPELAAALRRAAQAGLSAASGVLSAGAGEAIGSAFGWGIAQGIARARSGVAGAAAALRAAIPAVQSGSAQPAEVGKSGESAAKTSVQASQSESAGLLAQTVAAALEGVTLRMDGTTVGKLVAPMVSQVIARNATTRRYGTE